MKLFKLLTTFSSLITLVATLQEPITFDYSYKVIANSSSVRDVQIAYLYKESLIKLYESLTFEYEERDYQSIIINNLDKFCFDETCHCYYNGTINLIIGQGVGVTLKGQLKKNACDESVIHEKFYIFELFN